jgi:hypothetical protein
MLRFTGKKKVMRVVLPWEVGDWSEDQAFTLLRTMHKTHRIMLLREGNDCRRLFSRGAKLQDCRTLHSIGWRMRTIRERLRSEVEPKWLIEGKNL